MIKAGEEPTQSQLVDAYGSEVIDLRDAVRGSEGSRYMESPTTATIMELIKSGADPDETLAIQRRMIAETHTGNHYRNKSVSVPTAAGQPVRA